MTCFPFAGPRPWRAFARLVARTAALALVAAALPSSVHAAGAIVRAATSFDRAALSPPDAVAKVRASGSLAGPAGWGVSGWVEYDLQVPERGWYELTIEGEATEVTFTLNGNATVHGVMLEGQKAPKVGNFLLEAGRNVLRVERFFWTGFPQLRAVRLQPSDASLATSMRVDAGDGSAFGVNRCPPLEISVAARSRPTILTVSTQDGRGQPRQIDSFPLAAQPGVQVVRVPRPCTEPGFFTMTFGEGASAISWRDVRPVGYEVVAFAPPSVAASTPRRTLVEEIDLVQTPPDYASGATRVVGFAGGGYRESEPVGFTRYQRSPAAMRAALPAPSWFAYRLKHVDVQQPHAVEIDYPDDALRTFVVSLRESQPLDYPVSTGVDSGGEFTAGGRMRTLSLTYWPRAEGTRVVLASAHDGRRAAAARIRVFRLEAETGPLGGSPRRGRQVLNWYEEGTNFLSVYGAADEWDRGWRTAVDRWAVSARAAGATVLVPTAVVYSFALYPSRFNRAFSKPTSDVLGRIVLAAEANGLRVLPELHPRADELDWPFSASPDPKPNLLLSKDGRTNYYQPDGRTRNFPPFYNPIHPANQDWYVEMVGELAHRYRDSPAFLGVSLRFMQWANPTLNNFHSLDWGYDDYTVGRFARDTGIVPPVPGESRPGEEGVNARARYQWLMANARERWVQWRCERIADLYLRLRDRVRAERNDLQIYSTVFSWTPASDRQSLREAGIDPALLGGIDGVVLVYGMHGYGRREPDATTTQRMRDNLLDPARLNLLRGTGRGAFLAGANYIEATDAVIPPAALGFPSGTKATWTSAGANPAGAHAVERYAIQLAETDAGIVGDGGNGYSLGQRETREWLRAYLALPAGRFQPRPDARDPVAVWTRAGADAFWFYAVNRERYPVRLQLQVSGAQELLPVPDGRPVPIASGNFELDLEPYQLRPFRLVPGARLERITTIAPDAERRKVESMIEWVEIAARAAPDARSGDTAALAAAASDARKALGAGALWRARTRLERAELVAIYERLGRYPPGLRSP